MKQGLLERYKNRAMAKKFNFGFVGQYGLTKVSDCSADCGVNDSVFLVIESDFSRECSSLENIFNSKPFFEIGKKICKKYGLDATIICSFWEHIDEDNYCFDIISLNPNVVRSKPNNVIEQISDEDVFEDENAYQELIEKYSLGCIRFKCGYRNEPVVFIEKKHGNYLTHKIFKYDFITSSSECSIETAEKIFRAYVDALPLKLRKLSKPCCCFGAMGASGICVDCINN